MDYTDQEVNTIIDGEVRNGFIRKVYGILSAQLIITTAVAAPISRMEPSWIQANAGYCQAAMLLSLVLVLSVSICCQKVTRMVPFNYIFLLVVTVCYGVMVGFICALYTTQSVLMATGLTAGIFIGLTIYACTTKSDFTGMGGYLMAALIGLTLSSFVCMFLPYSPLAQKAMAGFGATLFSMYIVFDTQLICGGKHKQSFGVDDYVFAALNIYLDIINLFLYLLQLFGNRK